MQQGTVTQEQQFLLSRESSLAAMSIGQGLTLIRKYDFVKHGYGSQAFFMLSIGIERLLKLIIIYNYRRINNNQFPDNKILKKAGHDIKSMYDVAMQIALEIGEADLYKPLVSDPIYTIIVDFLTDFAHNSRYYNLDSLTGNPNNTDEPVRSWNEKINKLIVERHYKDNPRKIAYKESLTKIAQPHFIVSFNNEQGKEINNLKDFYIEGLTVDVKQKYSMFYVYCIARFLSNLLWNLDKNLFPLVSEYFKDFRISDDSYVRRLKVWNPYGR